MVGPRASCSSRGMTQPMPACRRWLLYLARTESSTALSTVGSVMTSRWGHSALSVPLSDSIQAWSVGVVRRPKC